MDALALLKKDHQTVEKLFARFEKRPSKEIADRFVRELSIHAAVEEQLFYPAVRQRAGRRAGGHPRPRTRRGEGPGRLPRERPAPRGPPPDPRTARLTRLRGSRQRRRDAEISVRTTLCVSAAIPQGAFCIISSL